MSNDSLACIPLWGMVHYQSAGLLGAGFSGLLGKSLIRSSLMLRCLRMGLCFGTWFTGDGRSTSDGEVLGELELVREPESEVLRRGGGVQSMAVCRGPYSHVMSESLSLMVWG